MTAPEHDDARFTELAKVIVEDDPPPLHACAQVLVASALREQVPPPVHGPRRATAGAAPAA